jgi:hypothetical protein
MGADLFMDWISITEERLLDLVNKGRRQMNPLERKFWDSICIDPEKWQQDSYGRIGNGFWVVAILGRTVLWYNDIEHGFNRSCYANCGTIPADEYWCNQDDLDQTVRLLMGIVATGVDPGGKAGPQIPGEYKP